jgi:hypothetical protein
MVMEGTADVPVSSPESELAAPVEQTETQPQEAPTAESQNTDKPPVGYVPLQALHEAREQLKGLKESQDWKGYSRLKEALDSDPNFAQHFMQSVQSYYQQQNQPVKDPYAEYPQEIAEPLRKTMALEQTVQQLVGTIQQQQTQAVMSNYKADLTAKLADVPDHWKPYYEKRAYEIGAQLNPQALQSYDPALVAQAYDAVQAEVESIRRAERGSYVTEKKNDKLPASSSATGQAGQTISRPNGTEDRSRIVEDLLKASLA